MLNLEPMVKIRAVCMHGHVEKVVAALYQFGDIQVMRSRAGVPDIPLPSFQKISENLIALRAMESLLKIDSPAEARMPAELDELLSQSDALRSEFSKIEAAFAQLDSLRSEEARLQQERNSLEPFKSLKVAPATFRRSERLSFYYGQLKTSEKQLLEALKGKPAQVSFAREPGKEYALVAYSRGNPDVPAILQDNFSSRLEAPDISQKSFKEAFASVESRIASLEKERGKFLALASAFAKKNAARIARLRCDLEEHAKQAELTNKFSKSDFLETMEGWIPAKDYASVEAALQKATGGKVFLERVFTRDSPPTKFSNPQGVRRFEFLLSTFSIPDSREIDPTFLVAISYPFMFGMILGDIGYGLLTAAIGLFLRVKKTGLVRDLGGMMALSGAWTVIFGYVYAEFFGGEEMLGLHLTPLIHRSGEGIQLLFGLTLLVGVIHLALGLVIGLVTNYRARHYNHAWAKFFWLVVEFSMVAAIYSLVFKQPALAMPALAALLVGAGGVYKFEGIQGIIEMPGLLSNGLSYLRIMALGLSGVIIAFIINQIPLHSAIDTLVKEASGAIEPVGLITSIISVLLFALVVVVGHGMALALGVFESGIQTLRLHYVEFFSKFYKGGGTLFSPLRQKQV